MTQLDLDGWMPEPFDLEREVARAVEHLHRSIGQRARWAMVDIRAAFARERELMNLGGGAP